MVAKQALLKKALNHSIQVHYVEYGSKGGGRGSRTAMPLDSAVRYRTQSLNENIDFAWYPNPAINTQQSVLSRHLEGGDVVTDCWITVSALIVATQIQADGILRW